MRKYDRKVLKQDEINEIFINASTIRENYRKKKSIYIRIIDFFEKKLMLFKTIKVWYNVSK